MKSYVVPSNNKLIIDSNINYLLDNSFNNVEIVVKSGVKTHLLTYNNSELLNLNLDIEKDAEVQIYHILESDISEHIYLKEKGSSVFVTAVILGTAKPLKSDIKIYHEVGLTNSDLKTYAITKGTSSINLINNAFIKHKAAGSIAHQSTKGLTLSKDSTILVEPNLYIDEYDVMASHGVAMGSLNQDDLFYLMSRGLTKENASEIVIMGFIEPLLTQIDNEEISNDLRKNFKEKLTKN